MKVTVFSGPDCHKCELTKKQLDRLGVAYDEVNLAENPDVAATWKAKGHTALPIVQVIHADGRGELWTDYRYARIKELGVCR